jgi:hypothetical protein
MENIQSYIVLVSWVMLTFGWAIHTLALMRHVEHKRRKPTSLQWFIKNRPRKFLSMLITPIPLGMIEYVVVAPESLDLSTMQDRLVLGGYLAAMLVTGAGSNKVIDKFGSNHSIGKIEEGSEEDLDDYGTRLGAVDEYIAEKKDE